MKAKLVFIFVHPSGYNKVWIDILSMNFDIKVFYLRDYDKYKSWAPSDQANGSILKFYTFAKNIGILLRSEYVVFDGWNFKRNLAIITLRTVIGKKNIIHSDFPSGSKNEILTFIKRIFIKFFVEYILAATTSTESYFVSKFGLDKSQVVFFPYPRFFKIALETIEIPRADNDMIKFLITSNFYKRKGYTILFEAIVLLEEWLRLSNIDFNKVEFNMCGVGEELDFFKEFSKDLEIKVNFHGWVDTKKYIELLKNCTVYVHPSILEPFGLPPLDAMALGKVVIVSDGVHSTLDLVVHGVNGFVYKCDDCKELFELFKSCLSADMEFDKIGERALLDVNEKYNKGIYTSAFNHILQIK